MEAENPEPPELLKGLEIKLAPQVVFRRSRGSLLPGKADDLLFEHQLFGCEGKFHVHPMRGYSFFPLFRLPVPFRKTSGKG